MVRIEIMNETGDTVLENLTAQETIEQIEEHPTHWVYVDGEMVSRQEIDDIDWDSVEEVSLAPAIVGGNA
jgi:hypothetical protein